jgi:hypothetical protein
MIIIFFLSAFEVLGFHDIIGQIDKGLDDDNDTGFEGRPYVGEISFQSYIGKKAF